MDAYKKLKTFACIFSLALAPFCLYAQEEPGMAESAEVTADEVADELLVETDISTEKTADSLIDEFLNERGWLRGQKNTKKDGSTFYVATGVGVIAAPINHKNYNNSRILAYDKAILAAKADLARQLEVELSSSVMSSLEHTEGEINETPNQELEALDREAPPSGILDKTTLWISKKLDNALKAEGYDIDSEKAKTQAERERIRERAKAIINQEAFQKQMSAAATMSISGLQAFYTVEAQNGDNGEIGVVAIWSEKLRKVAESIQTGALIKGAKNGKTIKEQIPASKKELLSTFGVQQKINERGEYVLLSFAQGAAASSSSTSKRVAYSKARLQAETQIRQFAGETVSMSEVQQSAEQKQEFDDASFDYSNQDSFKQFQKSVAGAMKCNGIAEVYRWTAVHPISGKPVFGVICSWSPSGAASAREVKKAMASSPKPSSAKNASKTSSPKSSRYSGGGAAGDEDAF